MQKISQVLVVVLFLIFGLSQIAQAGFGISPPYVSNDKLTRSSYYEQKIILVRGDPVEDLKAKISIDVPEIGDWFSIDKGTEFILPKGEKQVPMIVKVNVPKDAKYKKYNGYIRITTSSVKPLEEGKISIALGARIDVDLTISEIEIFDFNILSINVSDLLEEGWKFWKIKFPGKIKVFLKTINTGNIKAAPTRVHLDIYDINCKDLLESSDNTNLKKIKPFETKEILAKFKTKLEIGPYCGKIKIFKEDELVKEQNIFFNIVERGTLPSEAKEVFGINIWLWIIIGIIALSGIGYGGYRKYYRFFKKENLKRKKPENQEK